MKWADLSFRDELAGRRRGREIRERGKDSGAWASQGQRAGGLTGLEDC